MRVEVVYALPGRVEAVALDLPSGSTVADALAAAGFVGRVEKVGIYGKVVSRTTKLADGDRLEVYRPLTVDPKEARRRRARRRKPTGGTTP